MKIGDIKFTPIGNELGYCIGEHLGTKERNIYYFEGYPDKEYKHCQIKLVPEADLASFTSDTIMGEGKDNFNKYFKGRIVIKGTGKLLSQDWVFMPHKGISCDDISIYFGMKRTDIRNSLNNEQEFNYSRGEQEDSYEEFQNTKTWFRLSYNEKDLLQEIEFLDGNLRYHDVIIIGGAQVKDILKEFEALGSEFIWKNTDLGSICEELKASISSSSDMGGEGDECVYFYTSSDISHLLDEVL